MIPQFAIVLRDEAHLRAHLSDFSVGLDQALEWARARLESSPGRSGEVCLDFAAPRVVGSGGLKVIRPWTRGDYWGRREGRSIPSHLVEGRRRPTRRLCVRGFWKDESTFVLHTIYPGRAAPREIHDPELALEDLPGAIAFWSRHAIIVPPGGRDR